MARRRRPARRSSGEGEPVAFVLLAHGALVLALVLLGLVAPQLGVDPTWAGVAACIVAALGAISVIRARQPRRTTEPA